SRQHWERWDGAGGEAAAGQAAFQSFLAAGEAALDGADRPAEAPGRLVVGQPFQEAKDDRFAVAGGQSAEFLVEDRGGVVALLRFVNGARLCPSFNEPPTRRGGAGLGGDPERDAVEPARDRVAFADRTGAAGQNEKRGLKGVLG